MNLMLSFMVRQVLGQLPPMQRHVAKAEEPKRRKRLKPITPASWALAEAQARGAETYEGAYCKTCHTYMRYTKTRDCVACTDSGMATRSSFMQAKYNRAQALATGAATYEGRPCTNCGNCTRITSHSECVHCQKTNKRVRK